MTPFNDLIVEERNTNIEEIITANANRMPVCSAGDVIVNVENSEIGIKNVLCVPELSANLLSVAQIVKNGNQVIFDQEGCKIFNKAKDCIVNVKSVNGTYKLQTNSAECMISTTHKVNAMTWHRRLGHINFMDLCKMKNGLVTGMDFNEYNEQEIRNYTICKECKQTRLPFPKSTSRANNILDLIHSDLVGPMENKSFGGARYIFTFIDDHSRKIFTYFIKEKFEVLDKFIEFKAMVERETNKKIKVLRTDNGTEYVNFAFKRFLSKCDIRHQRTNTYTPEQNGWQNGPTES